MTHRIVPADPFTIRVSDGEIEDLKRRLQRTRFPNEPLGNEHWEYGTNLSYMGPAEGSALLKPGEKVTVPTAYSEYPIDILPDTPRSWAERSYNIARWRMMDCGGHFAAMEEPQLFADDVRDAFRGMGIVSGNIRG